MNLLVVKIWLLSFFMLGTLSAQYYTPAAITAVETARAGKEGDMYLDTLVDNYKIGLTHGKLGVLVDEQSLDSLTLESDSLELFIERGNSATVDVSSLIAFGSEVGDIKCGVQTADHYGWYLMDGRVLTALPATAQTNAATLGIVGNLPDASNRIIKTKAGAEALLSTGGNASYTLVQGNIPSYNLVAAGVTSNSGSHTHTAILDSSGLHGHSSEGSDFGIEYKGFSNSGSNDDTALVISGANTFATDSAGKHIHTYTINTAGGSHDHTISLGSGGSDTPISLYQPYMVANRFIYLEQ